LQYSCAARSLARSLSLSLALSSFSLEWRLARGDFLSIANTRDIATALTARSSIADDNRASKLKRRRSSLRENHLIVLDQGLFARERVKYSRFGRELCSGDPEAADERKTPITPFN